MQVSRLHSYVAMTKFAFYASRVEGPSGRFWYPTIPSLIIRISKIGNILRLCRVISRNLTWAIQQSSVLIVLRKIRCIGWQLTARYVIIRYVRTQRGNNRHYSVILGISVVTPSLDPHVVPFGLRPRTSLCAASCL